MFRYIALDQQRVAISDRGCRVAYLGPWCDGWVLLGARAQASRTRGTRTRDQDQDQGTRGPGDQLRLERREVDRG